MPKNPFRKTAALLLAAVMLFSFFPVPAHAAGEDAVRFAVAADVHLRLPDASLDVYYPESELYYSCWGSGNQTHESTGLLLETLARAQENGAQFVLLCGDLTHYGNATQHKYFASLLRGFEEESGIPVYVVPGNHDYYETTPAAFKEYYADFGYAEALAADDVTASYTADLPGGYRLIAIDSNDPGNDGDGLDDRLFGWIGAQAEAAAADGKTPIVMMHHPLLEPIPYASLLMKNFIVRDHEAVAERFAGWGVSYVFTGHEHGNNVTSFTAADGSVVYDILTTSLNSYPTEFRMADLCAGSMTISMERLESLDPAYIPPGYNEAQRRAIEEDYTAYSLGFFKFSVAKKIERVIAPGFIKDALGQDSGALADAVDVVMPLVAEALNMPFYNGAGDTVAALAAKSGAQLPPSDYENLMDLITSLVAVVYEGGENLPVQTSPEGKIFMVALNTLLKYVLAQSENQVTKDSLNRIFGVLGFDGLDQVDLYRWNRAYLPGADYSYAAAQAALTPLLNKFLVDDDVPDRDAMLIPSEAANEDGNVFAAFLRKLKAFFDRLAALMKALVSFGGR